MNTNIGRLVKILGPEVAVDICKKQKSPKTIAEKILLWGQGEFQLGGREFKQLISDNRGKKDTDLGGGKKSYTLIDKVYPMQLAIDSTKSSCPLFPILLSKSEGVGFIAHIPLKMYVQIDPVVQAIIHQKTLEMITAITVAELGSLMKDISDCYAKDSQDETIKDKIKSLESKVSSLKANLSNQVCKNMAKEIDRQLEMPEAIKTMEWQVTGSILLNSIGGLAALIGAGLSSGPGLVLGIWAGLKAFHKVCSQFAIYRQEWITSIAFLLVMWEEFVGEYDMMIQQAQEKKSTWSASMGAQEAASLLESFITGNSFFITGTGRIGEALNDAVLKNNRKQMSARKMGDKLDRLLLQQQECLDGIKKPSFANEIEPGIVVNLESLVDSLATSIHELILNVQAIVPMVLFIERNTSNIETLLSELQKSKPKILTALDYSLFASDLALNYNSWITGGSLSDYGAQAKTSADQAANILAIIGGTEAKIKKILDDIGVFG